MTDREYIQAHGYTKWHADVKNCAVCKTLLYRNGASPCPEINTFSGWIVDRMPACRDRDVKDRILAWQFHQYNRRRQGVVDDLREE